MKSIWLKSIQKAVSCSQEVEDTEPEAPQSYQYDHVGYYVLVLALPVAVVLLQSTSLGKCVESLVHMRQGAAQHFLLRFAVLPEVLVADPKVELNSMQPAASHVQSWPEQASQHFGLIDPGNPW